MAVICLLLVWFAATVTLALSSETITRYAITRRNINRDRAMCIAEAGVDYGMRQLALSQGYTGTSSPVSFGGGAFSVSVATNGDIQTVTSTGSVNGATVQLKVVLQTTSGGSGNGAILSNGNVTFTGNGNTQTDPSNRHEASVYANGNISGTGNASIDGRAWASGTVSLGANGQAYDPSYPRGRSGAPALTFPTQSYNNTWQSQLISAAQAGGTVGGISSSTTLAAPKYVNGNVTLSGNDAMTITGPGTVYVNGNLSLSGNATLTNGATLVVSGTISISGDGGYSITGNPANVALISFSSSSTAISLVGNASAIQQGVIYAANGGITVTGNGYVYGALVAAGQSGNGHVNFTGNASVRYPVELLNTNTIVPTNIAPSGTTTTTVTSWHEM